MKSFCALIVCLLPCAAANAWFKPSLARDADPICEQILKGTIERFVTPAPVLRGEYRNPQPFAGLTRVDVQTLKSERPGESILPTRDGPLYMQSRRRHGCGGACESQWLQFSDRAFSESGPVVQTYAAAEWELYKNGSGDYFALARSGKYATPQEVDPLIVYRVTRPESWKLSCEVKMAPTEQELPPAIRAVREGAVLPFQGAVLALMGDAGWSCGSLRTHDRWQGYVADSAFQMLFRPWALQDYVDDEYGTYDRDIANLDLWSLEGLMEYEALAAYKRQFDRTHSALTSVYAEQFGLRPPDAGKLATLALQATASAGIRFYEHSPPFKDEALRRAILEKRPIEEIRRIRIGMPVTDAQESILNLAVTYPEALRYLLDKGFDPDRRNAFGKTPLMYAAQRDQVEAMTLLLEHGADPDAATTAAPDECYYKLQTTGMTALHYAARYASLAAIRVLLEHRAFTFLQAEGENAGTPLEWLQKYTAVDATERNPNMVPEDVPIVASVLQIPSPAELRSRAARLRAQARNEYAAGKPEAAFRMLRTAMKIEDAQGAALNDFALIALRAGRIGESLAASTAVTRSEEARERAAAWFNLGLACEQAMERYFIYDGRYYCVTSLLDPFLRSWQAEPTAARAEKLNQVFQSDAVRSCLVGAARGRPRRVHIMTDKGAGADGKPIRTRVLVHHLASQPFAAEELPSAHFKATYVLGTYAISVLESEHYSSDPITVSGEACTGYG